MTTSQRDGHPLVVVDGSNIATEGRSSPSLEQLNDAVLSFRDEHPESAITVVVDATFGHRIDKSEVKAFDEAVAHNEVVAPPAGAIGRGDAFVLSIAHKVGATILSNDSFQEFHGQYPWLFDEGRLIGGKPVPNIGWVFVNRVPVKGPVSRKARAGANANAGRRTASKMASQPMPVPTQPPPGSHGRSGEKAAKAAKAAQPKAAQPKAEQAPARQTPSGGPVNDLLPFLEFVELHPVGSSVSGVVESYSSHGAYVTIADLRGYVPLRLMADPPPRSAREVLKLGEAVTLVVTSFAPARRSVDLAVPAVAAAVSTDAPTAPRDGDEQPTASASKRSSSKKSTGKQAVQTADTPVDADAPKPAKKSGGRKRAAAVAPPAADDSASIDVSVEAQGATAALAPTKKSAAKKTAPAKRAAAKKAAATTVAPATEAAPARKATAKKAAPATTATTETTAAKKTAARKTAAPATKASAKKSAAKKSAAKTSAANKTAANKATAKRSTATKSTASGESVS